MYRIDAKGISETLSYQLSDCYPFCVFYYFKCIFYILVRKYMFYIFIFFIFLFGFNQSYLLKICTILHDLWQSKINFKYKQIYIKLEQVIFVCGICLIRKYLCSVIRNPTTQHYDITMSWCFPVFSLVSWFPRVYLQCFLFHIRILRLLFRFFQAQYRLFC